ncbi:erythroblast NAD(P)(+)--arginine ADP-ribosyltransferase-like [Pithys albifrons albifrons]|uniref:erythroblast NAD(P)(+)--arginine ADP-ribosyltransferase-like n=1 Tax=Pithys albifrons albifrons TaxID=3385563 RepID=UPI003A5CE3FF
MELLPLVLVLLAGTLATGIEEMALDMAPNSFDDQYQDCRDEMVEEMPALNHSEFVFNSNYSKAWDSAIAHWQSHPSLGTLHWKEQAIALLAYTLETDLYKAFNKAVPRGGRSQQDYLDNFHFKVVHFLLTEALDDLRDAESHPVCLHVYRGVRGIRFTAKPGQIIRFGQFTSTSLKKEVAKGFGTDTFFEVDTCHGAKIRDFSFMPWEEEVLIPPFETFNVTNVTRQSDTTYILLRSQGVYSKYNCAWLRGRSVPREPPHLAGLLLASLALAVATGTT